jgi:hypothetical protein
MKAYIWTYVGVDRQPLLDFIDKIPEIVNWQAGGGAIFLISEQSPDWISEKIHSKFPDLNYIIMPVDIVGAQGYTQKDVWDFLQRPRRAGQP